MYRVITEIACVFGSSGGHIIKHNVLEDDRGGLSHGQERPQDGNHTTAMETTQSPVLLGVYIRQCSTTVLDHQPGESQQTRNYCIQ